MTFEKPPVIVDLGSHLIKTGFACDNHPVTIFRNVVGRPRDIVGRFGRIGTSYDVFIGDEAIAQREVLNLDHPVVNGRIVNWDNIERVWHHIYYRELKVAPEDRGIIMAVSNSTPMNDKIKCCEIFFETLNAPACCIQNQASLALYGAGNTTGICVDMGYDTTDICPVYEGSLMGYAHVETGYAVRQVKEYLEDRIAKKGVELGANADYILEYLIQKQLSVLQIIKMPRKGYQRYMQNTAGDRVEISQDLFMTAELFFQPEDVYQVDGQIREYKSLQGTITASSYRVDEDLRLKMYSSIVLCGGLCMIPGLSERLKTELEIVLKKPVNIIWSDESYATTWLGCATFAGIPGASKSFVTKKQYEEHGERIVKNKFL